MAEKQLLAARTFTSFARPAIDDRARRLRMQRLAHRIAASLDRLVRAEERARIRLGHPVWTDRLRTR